MAKFHPNHATPELRFLLVFLFALTLGSAPAASQMSLSAESGYSTPGGTITLNLTLGNLTPYKPTSLQWTINFPASDISSMTVAEGPAAISATKTIDCTTLTGTSTCVLWGINTNPIPAGVVASFTFQIASNPLDTNIPIQITGPFAAESYGFKIGTTSSDGAINLTNSVTLTGFSCDPIYVVGPASSLCVVTLSGSAPPGGFPVTLNSNNDHATLVPSIVLNAGNISASITVSTAAVNYRQVASLTASALGVTHLFAIVVTPPAAMLSSLTCVPAIVPSAGTTACTVSVSSVARSSVKVALQSDNSSLTLPASLVIPANAASAAFTATAGTIGVDQAAVVTATGSGNSQNTTLTLSAAPALPGALSIWSAQSIPGNVSDPDPSAVELGLKFQSDVAGLVTGVRFYKGAANAGVHTGHLWSAAGLMLAEVVFLNETVKGWQQAIFPAPVSIKSNAVYTISYYTSVGHYSSDSNFFTAPVDSVPLHAIQDRIGSPNGVYIYGPSSFPNQNWQASNYWVDVIFKPNQVQVQ